MYNYGYSSSDMSQYLRTLDGLENSEGFLESLGALLGVYIVILLVIAILQIIALWKVFKKAGEKGWKSIIPFYNICI